METSDKCVGTFGLGDMLIKMGIKYGSIESIELIDSVFKFIAKCAVRTSLELAQVKGCYPMCNKGAIAQSKFIQNLDLSEKTIKEIEQFGLYNSQLLTCAPTGTTATMLGVSTGVEPNYAFSFNRRTVSLNNEETTYKVEADIVKQYKAKHKDTDVLPDFFISSQEIDPYNRVDVQAAIQNYVDASISSTINLPESTTVEDIAKIYLYAWDQRCKGITIWRDQCQRQGILSTDKKKTKEEQISEQVSLNTENAKLQINNPHELKRGEVIKCSNHWLGLKRTLTTGCGTLHVESFWDPESGELRECYLSKGSTGGCNNFMIGLSRMISLAARGGLSIDSILDQLKSCGVCPSYAVRAATKNDTSKGSCCPVAVGNALRNMHKEIQDIICECNKEQNATYKVLKVGGHNTVTGESFEKEINKVYSLEECPNCHEKSLVHVGGCVECPNCGWTRCS